MEGQEELVFSLVEADYMTARMARQIGAYILANDSDYYIIGGLA